MKKYNKFDYLSIFIITFSFFVVFFLILKGNNVMYGSSLDYANPHYLIPDYFRKLFYETKDLFPSWAFNLGMGQNIYYFSYYGLFSPIILISYLLPFIKMADYIMISSVVIIIISIILFYKWISNHFENRLIRFIITFIFAMASPLIFHSHRHIMFINYMPFLLMGLLGIDRYVLKDKKILLMISIFLIILTSYFFSVPALVVLFLYGIFLYINKIKDKNYKDLIKFALKLCMFFIIPILMASILLIPTLYAILNSRFSVSNDVNLLSYLIPNLSLETVLYNHYSLGITAIFILALAYLLFIKEKGYKFLFIVFMVVIFIPIIDYLLNGFMYLNAKVFIPFLPLAVFLVGKFLKDFIDNKIEFKKLLIVFVIISILGCLNFKYYYIYIADVILVSFILFLAWKTKNSKYLLLLLLINLAACIIVNLTDDLESKKVLDSQYNETVEKMVSDITLEEDNIYRIGDNTDSFHNVNNIRDISLYKTSMYSSLTNKYYKNFYWNEINNEDSYRNDSIFSDLNNVLFNVYAGNKYYLSTLEEDIIGYRKVNSLDNINLYQNDDVFSLGYSMNKLMSLKEYESLEYPYNVEALLNYTIVDDDSIVSNYESKINELEVKQDSYSFEFYKDTNIVKEIKGLDKDSILLIKFDMNYSESCKVGDTSISINGVKNKLTCKGWKYHNHNYTFEYVISSNSAIRELNIEFSKGKYDISNLEVYELDYNDVKSIKNNHDEFMISKEDTKGDIIKGNITVREDGYFSMSIPYDKGFTIYVDGKKTDYELVNTSFIGFPLEKGNHEIEIIYEAPGLLLGQVLAGVGVILFLGVTFIEVRRSKR